MFEDLISAPASARHPKARPGPRQSPEVQKLLREQKIRRQAEQIWNGLSGERVLAVMRDDAHGTLRNAVHGFRSTYYTPALRARPELLALLLRRQAEVLAEGAHYGQRLGRGIAEAARVAIDFEAFGKVPERFRTEALRRLRIKYNWPAATLELAMVTHGKVGRNG